MINYREILFLSYEKKMDLESLRHQYDAAKVL